MLPRCYAFICLTIVSFAVLGPIADAQTSFPMLGCTFPTGVQRGKTTDVTIMAGGNGGSNLNGVYKVLFEGEGVKAEIVPPEKGWPAKDPKKPWDLPGVGEVKMRVTVAADAPLGVREYRVATPRMGISTIGQLVIGDEPELTEVESGGDIAKAQAVPIPSVVNGRLEKTEDIDLYKFKVAAGQEVVFTAQCARLEDKIHDLQGHADPLLILTDTSGKEIARNDDYYRADPLLHYKFEKAGEYVVQIRDVNYGSNPQGGTNFWVYRLNITSRPYVTAVVPCAVKPGVTNTLHVTGFNLGDTKTVNLMPPPNAPKGIWEAQLSFPQGASNLVPLLVTDAPQLTVEGRATANTGNKTVTAALGEKAAALPRLPLPGGVNSWIATDGQKDRYSFHAKAGEHWAFTVTARRLDSEMDSEIKIRDAKGNALASNDDAIGKDSRLEWQPPSEGDYTIEIRDLTGHSGPTFFYNLSAERVLPDFRLRCDTDRALIAPGNRTSWYILAERQHGFAGPIKVEIKGLPAGVTVTPLTIPPEVSQATLILSAAPDAKIDAALVQVVGTATLAGEQGKSAEVSHSAHPLTEIYMPGGGRGLMEAETQGVSVTETNDLEVAANMQQVSLAPGGSVKIEITLKRRPDYTKSVTIDVKVQHLGQVFIDPLPPGVSVDEGASKLLLNDNETKGYITLKAAPDAKPIKDLPLAVFANVSINFVMKVWYAAPPMSLTVTAPPKK